MKIVLATRNAGKIAEIKAVLDMPGIQWLIHSDDSAWPEVVEDGDTFLANATKKARVLAEHFDLPALADDSGLEVDALAGKPGIYSARFAGPDGSDADNIVKLLNELKDVPDNNRQAAFVAVVALVWPDGRIISATGTCPGTIVKEPRGERGFGYDPVFAPLERSGDAKLDLSADARPARTMAEMTAGEKNSLSHRGKALRSLSAKLKELGVV